MKADMFTSTAYVATSYPLGHHHAAFIDTYSQFLLAPAAMSMLGDAVLTFICGAHGAVQDM